MPRRPTTFEFGPFKGMRYTEALPPSKDYAFHAKDMILQEDGQYWRRPCFDAPRQPNFNQSAVQGVFAFNLVTAGLAVAVVNGEIWTTDGVTGWTKQVTQANLTTAAITLSTSAQVYGCQFGNKYIFNDGINQPFAWDGTAGAGGLTKLTNAPTKCFGRPTVYYAKLFFIKDVAAAGADRNTMVWSEENQPNTGYEAGGFNNSWPLVQMGQGGLYALLGLNDGLYYFRRTSIGVVRGAVNTDFRAAGVHDDVSLEHGTTSPRGVSYYKGRIWFVDTTGHPCSFLVGGPQEAPWGQIEGALGDWGLGSYLMSSTDIANAVLCPCAALDCMTFWLRDGNLGTAGFNRAFCFGASGVAWSEWSLPGGAGAQALGRFPEDVSPLPFGPRPGLFFFAKDSAAANSTWYECDMPTQGASSGRYQTANFPDTNISPHLVVLLGDRRGGIQYRFERFDVTTAVATIAVGSPTLRLQPTVGGQQSVPDPQNSLTVVGANVTFPLSAGVFAVGRRASWTLKRHGAWLAVGVQEPVGSAAPIGWGITSVAVRAYPAQVSASMATA
jgi:hypothetical protein